ncbi:outer membrane beta-barrel protein [Povalibacter sp.]|uniref:outer membrane beta-barrel protein n=1 Tax=Povalibacter sp. TaxID=1962978 RepID=UPI002F4159FF
MKFILSDRYTYDDNLFRLPDGREAVFDPLLGPPRSVEDQINRASAGLRVRLDASRQVFHADVRIDDVRYRNNDDLDYTGGSADVLWDWQVASDWSGRLFAKYDRSQANLENYRFFEQDVVEAATYGGELRYGMLSRWRIFAGAAAADTDHSARLRQTENFESTTGRGGVEYTTPAGSSLAAEYLMTNAEFPEAEALAGAPRGYEETIPTLRGRYVLSVKTTFTASLGYLDRDYDNPASTDYSGEVWTVGMYWEPRTKLSFELEAWHKLRAYVDAESDYFVGEGVSIAPVWKPTTMIELSAKFSYEKQDYVGNTLFLPPIDTGREDTVQYVQAGIEWTPRDFISLGLAYRWNDRDSNREFRSYGQNQSSAQIRLMF